ncbi:MAG: winged helix-turn-helix domain-containing protein, partial [Actinobacteria bacterium]|nr:winged helix-turn-helix domain-containing protein [Actinomycetota bacterium]
MIRFRILGPIEVVDSERPLPLGGRRQLALLAFLLLHANRVVSADVLLDKVWPKSGPERRGALKVAIVRLRKALEPLAEEASPVQTQPAGYRLAVAEGELDADVFEAAVADGRQALAAEDPRRAAEALRGGLALWRGPALAEVAYEDFAQAEIRRLDELRLSARELLLEAELAAGRHREVLPELEALVAELEPVEGEHALRERLYGYLMLALYRCGRQAEALEAFEQARRMLKEVGLEPGPELRRVQTAVLRHDAWLQLAPAAGELPAELDDAARVPLVGRADELAQLRRRWDVTRHDRGGAVVVITGPTGMGKTRLAAELAREAAGAGAVVVYVACNGSAAGVRASAGRARQAPTATLLVVDDLDRADADAQAVL